MDELQHEVDVCRKVTLNILTEIETRILGKRGKSTEMWVRARKEWNEKDPYLVRDSTLLEIAVLVKEYRMALKKNL